MKTKRLTFVTLTAAALLLFSSAGWTADDDAEATIRLMTAGEPLKTSIVVITGDRFESLEPTLRAASEHSVSDDPYLFEVNNDRRFLDFGFEQQGSIVEEFVCCRALAPQAPRTKRLHALISQEMPLAALPQSRPSDVQLPWSGLELDGICG